MSRSSDIVAHLQQRRTERKKPRCAEPLKKMSLDMNQKSAVSGAQKQFVSQPVTLQKTTACNCTALTVSLALHVIVALIISVFYIADRFVSETDKFAGVFIVIEYPPTNRHVDWKNPFRKLHLAERQIVPRNPVKPNPSLSPLNESGVIPQTPGTLDVPGPLTKDAPRTMEPKKELQRPTKPAQVERKPRYLGPKRSQKPQSNQTDPVTPKEPRDLPLWMFWSGNQKQSVPQFKRAVKPAYPATAKRAEKEGTVILQTTIDADGIPQDIVAVTNLGYGFEEAAIAALRKFTFVPATQSGKPVSKTVQIPFEFTLED